MKRFVLEVVKIKNETGDVKTFVFVAKNTEKQEIKINFKAGQFLNLFFTDNVNGHGKPYTISSAPNEKLQITVKKIGSFSGQLHELEVGDEILAEGPFGFMTLEERDNQDNKIVFIAGGIGITPFYSMIKDVIYKKKGERMYLFYSNKSSDDVVYSEKLAQLSGENQNLNINHFLTNEENFGENIVNRRLKISDIEEKNDGLGNTDFYICGSISFVNDFWKGLKENGVKEENIFTEAFFVG